MSEEEDFLTQWFWFKSKKMRVAMIPILLVIALVVLGGVFNVRSAGACGWVWGLNDVFEWAV